MISYWSLLILTSSLYGSFSSSIITLPDGTQIQGFVTGNVTNFLGIPFAEPPINKLRWAPPVEWKNKDTSKILDGTKFGNTCAQSLWGHDWDQFSPSTWYGGDEDCLFLNVFAKISDSNEQIANRPVAIFIHGGSYMRGSSTIPLYDGVDMVEYLDGNVIIVTANYRLNIFGFLGSEELRQQDVEYGSTGNYGIQDQREAFKWVQKNIGISQHTILNLLS